MILSAVALAACAAKEPVTVWECAVYGISDNPGPKDNKIYIGLTNNSATRVTFARVLVGFPAYQHFTINRSATIKPKERIEFTVPLDWLNRVRVMAAKDEVQCSVSVAKFDDGTSWYAPK